jgi:lysozyme
MQPRHHVSTAAIALIKRFEGYRRSAARLADGRWTIGYGHARSAREGARVSEDDAAALLLYDLGEVSIALHELVFTPLSQNQFDALASFAMNIGVDEFRRSSVLLRLNEGALLQGAAEIEMWRKADFEGERIVVDALVRRRAAEKALFLTPDDGYVPTPTPVVRPRIDQDAPAPAETAVELIAPLEGDIALAQREGAVETSTILAPSSAEAAAAAVSARLQTMLDDLDLRDAREEAVPETAPTTSTPPPIVLPLPDPSWHARRALEEASVEPFPAPTEPVFASSSAHSASAPVEPFGSARFEGELERTPASYVPLALMLVVGVILLAVATFWFVAAHPKMGGAAPSIIGWVLGLTGVGLLASSIYFLLERIGNRDDEA